MSIEAPAGSAGRVKWCARRAAALLGIALTGLVARPAAAEDPRSPKEIAAARPVTLGEVATSVAAQSTRLINVSDLLRHDAEAELAAIDWTKTKSKHRYTLSALIVRLESAPLGARSLSASCTVSAAVRDERGALLAIVEGRARAEDAATAGIAAERDALAGAVRSAIIAVPEAIRRLQ
jgi:hypothetical protein